MNATPQPGDAPLRFDGRVAVVTGAGGGLGRAHALALAARGARVVVNDLGVPIGDAPAPTADAVVAEILERGGEAVADAHDVVDGAAVVATALEAFGRVDVVVNNAGVAGGGPLASGSSESWDRTIATTLHGSIAVTRAAWPHLGDAGGGAVVLTSSAAMFGAPGSGAYSSAKSAMFGLARSLAAEGAPAGIRVNAIMPAAWTRLTALLPPSKLTAALEERFTPEAVAAFVVWLCHDATTVSGEVFSVGAGRAARVFLAETVGATVEPPDDADAWATRLAEAMDPEGHAVLSDMAAEAAWQLDNLDR